MSDAFLDALTRAACPVVMEIKRTDGDGTDLLGGRRVREIVAEYERAGAPCLSVVTGKWFGGDPDLLSEVSSLTDLPLLRKDFITRRAQLEQSRELGAAAVLLTARLLPRPVLCRLVAESRRLGLTPFVEVSTAAEAAVAHGPEAVVAVANKDISVRERDRGDLDRSLELLPVVRGAGTRCPVSASGIHRPASAAALLHAGFAGLLVGTALLRADDIGAWVAELDQLRAAAVAS
ncbi:MAG: hypothetical protein ACR2GH_22715 [Pseudonocardia sp.]